MIGVPFAKSLDPVTQTNWEGTGVPADVKVPAADALAAAEKLAEEKIRTEKGRGRQVLSKEQLRVPHRSK
jgi:hypothetical protein